MYKKFFKCSPVWKLVSVSNRNINILVKDYEDEHHGLSERVLSIEKTMADLNTKFGSFAYM